MTRFVCKYPALLGIIFVCYTGIACSQDIPKEVPVPAGFEKYTDEAAGFSLLKPLGWTAQTRTGVDNRSYLVFSSTTDTMGFQSNIAILVSDSLDKSIGRYTQDILAQYLKLFKKFDFESRDTLRINNITFGTFVIKYSLGNKPYRMNTVYTVHDNTLYQLNATAPLEKYEEDKDIFWRIIESFTVIP